MLNILKKEFFLILFFHIFYWCFFQHPVRNILHLLFDFAFVRYIVYSVLYLILHVLPVRYRVIHICRKICRFFCCLFAMSSGTIPNCESTLHALAYEDLNVFVNIWPVSAVFKSIPCSAAIWSIWRVIALFVNTATPPPEIRASTAAAVRPCFVRFISLIRHHLHCIQYAKSVKKISSRQSLLLLRLFFRKFRRKSVPAM